MSIKHKNEKGQAMVEFALVLPILLLFIAGIIDFGWIFHNQLAANNASREAARYVAIHYYVDLNADETARLEAKDIIEGYVSPNINDINVTVVRSSDDAITGEKIKVNFTGKVAILTPFLSTIIGSNNFPINAECTMRIEN